MDAIKWPKIGAKLANVSSKNFSPFKLSPLLLQKEGHNLGEACDALAMFAGPMVRISLCVCPSQVPSAQMSKWETRCIKCDKEQWGEMQEGKSCDKEKKSKKEEKRQREKCVQWSSSMY